MVEHLAKVVAIDPFAARCTSIKMSLFGQIAQAMANAPPARKLNDRAVRSSPSPVGAEFAVAVAARIVSAQYRPTAAKPEP
jgi:hypothetical protein